MKHLIPIVFLCSLTSCALPMFGVEPRFGPVSADGDFGISSSGFSANNSVDAMGIDDDDGAFSVRGDFKWGGPHLSVTLQESTHDGSGTLDADLIEDGLPAIPAGTDVDTDFSLGLHTAYLTWDLVPGDFELGLGVGVVALDVDLMTTDDMGNSIEADELLPIPVLALRAAAGVGPVDLQALVGAMTLSSGSDDVTFIDADLNARIELLGVSPGPTGWLTAGLRYTDLDLEFDDDGDNVAVDLQFTGPYIGLRVVL